MQLALEPDGSTKTNGNGKTGASVDAAEVEATSDSVLD
jgi:hypothetical protein